MGTKEQMVKIHQHAMKNQKKALIDKACNWLMQYGCQYATEEVMVEHFRKVMEE